MGKIGSLESQPAKQGAFARWWVAVKPGAFIKLAMPILVGCGYALQNSSSVSPLMIIIIAGFLICVQLYIVLLNDYADKDADALHSQHFPGLIDQRVISEGKIREQHILWAGLGAAFAIIALAFYLSSIGRTHAFFLLGGGLLTFWAYSFPPVRLNYRGFGEVLEALGVGYILPLTAYYVLVGEYGSFATLLVAPILLLALAGALASGLKHEPADRLTGKKTFCVLCGAPVTVDLIVGLQSAAVSVCLWLFLEGIYDFMVLAGGVVIAGYFMLRAFSLRKTAHFENLAGLKKFKSALVKASLATHVGLFLNFVI